MKSFTDLFIRRPVLALVVSLVIIIAGLQAMSSLTVRQYPRSDIASVTVTTVYVGASAELVRGFITTPLERAIAAADGIDYLQSSSAQGVSIAEIVVNHRAREHGQSKYGIGRTVRVMLDLLTLKFLLSYSTRPLQMFGLIGLVLGLLGTLISGWLAYERLRGAESLSNRPLLLLGILLILTGFQLVTLGLLAELQARTYRESTNKPTYAIREIRESLPADTQSSETFR